MKNLLLILVMASVIPVWSCAGPDISRAEGVLSTEWDGQVMSGALHAAGDFGAIQGDLDVLIVSEDDLLELYVDLFVFVYKVPIRTALDCDWGESRCEWCVWLAGQPTPYRCYVIDEDGLTMAPGYASTVDPNARASPPGAAAETPLRKPDTAETPEE